MKPARSCKIVDNEHPRVGKWLQELGGGFYRDGSTCIGLERNGELVAGTMYDWYNGASIYMSVAAIGKHWLNREFLWFAFYYPFEQLKANVILALVSSSNYQARKFDEHLGFTLHTEIEDADPNGSLLVYTMKKPDCRWLNLKVKHEAKSTACA
jgi:RimJ/RimL family protein N-acetyltransferase